jgi:hypothetical protein
MFFGTNIALYIGMKTQTTKKGELKMEKIKLEREELERGSLVVYKGYRWSDLKRQIDSVTNPDDWRGPIEVFKAPEHVAITIAAIEFFTATEPKVSPLRDAMTGDIMAFEITSEGYRNGPAGP